jgi:RNA polymerase sigma-70 factor (ECF subfamily)
MDGETLEWIRRSQAGDTEAFGLVFNKYKNLVYKTAYLMLGSASEAEDLMQEVFIEVFRSLKSYQPARGAFTTWLYRITVNDCLNHRRSLRWTSVSLEEVAYAAHEDPGAPDEAVGVAIRGLSPKLRAVVILRYYWDLSYAEITQVLNLPLGTVKSRLNQALHMIKRDLETQVREDRDALGPDASFRLAGIPPEPN